MTDQPADREWDLESDVIVVGSGGGAMTGAFTAAQEGLSVTLLEASDRLGGTTAYSGGAGMWFPMNAVLRRAGDDDTMEQAEAYYHAVVGDRTPRELQDTFLHTGKAVVDYLEAADGMAFQVLPWPDYYGKAPHARAGGRHIQPQPLDPAELGEKVGWVRDTLDAERRGAPLPSVMVGGRALVGRLLKSIGRFDGTDRAVDIRRGHTVTDLITESVGASSEGAAAGTRVVGVLARTADGATVRVRARRGVLLAAGGFEGNQELRDRYGVPGQARDTMGPPTNQGLAHLAGMAAGADTDLMEQAWWSPGMTHPDGRSTFTLWFFGGIFVDDQGARFVDESWPYDRIGRAVIDRMSDGSVTLPYWFVYDDAFSGRPPVRVTSLDALPWTEQQYRDAGLRFTADTVEELAGLIGVPPDALVTSVNRFNELVEKGHDDDFGRGDEMYDRAFCGPDGSPLTPITQGPFHATAFGISDLGTKGGLRTDTSARVLRADGSVIGGLYAAGNTMAAVSGETYPGGGNPIGSCMVFSFLAAKDMASAG